MAGVAVLGASQGGVEALREIVRALPEDFPATILVVLHTGAHSSVLPWLLSESGPLPAAHARQDEPIEPGRIYVAPPDRHMLAVDGHLELTRGPRENWSRPAIDPTLRTVAEAYGTHATGVILTGHLNDGTAGLYELKRRGGTAIVQDPAQAAISSMPQSAREHVNIDHCLPLAEIADCLTRLARAQSRRPPRGVPIAMTEAPLTRPVAQTCPECGGAMREEDGRPLLRYRCHIGHVMSAEILAAAQLLCLERSLSEVYRLLHEREELCRARAGACTQKGDPATARSWHAAAAQASQREDLLQDLLRADWLHPEDRDAGR